MHPLHLFNFCPKCGSDQFLVSSPASKKCAACGFEFFKNPVIGVSVAAFDDQDRLLCIRRAKNPGKGLLGLPGGFVDIGERVQQAAVREVKEETGIDVVLTRLLDNIPNSYIYSGMDQFPLDFYFGAVLKNMDEMTVQKEEVNDILFIPRTQINPDDFAMPSTQVFLKKLLSQ